MNELHFYDEDKIEREKNMILNKACLKISFLLIISCTLILWKEDWFFWPFVISVFITPFILLRAAIKMLDVR